MNSATTAVSSGFDLLQNLTYGAAWLFIILGFITAIQTTNNSIHLTRFYYYLSCLQQKLQHLSFSETLDFVCKAMKHAQTQLTSGLLTEANQRASVNFSVVMVLGVLLPIAASINALAGGSPFLIQFYLGIFLIFALLLFTGEINWLERLNQVFAFVSAFGVLVFIPVYVVRSFTHAILTNSFNHSVITSLLVAVFWYVTVFCLWQFIVFVAPKNKRLEAVLTRWIAPFLCVLPLALILAFFFLLLGKLAVFEQSPYRSWGMLIAVTSGFALSYTLMYNILLRSFPWWATAVLIFISSGAVSFFIYFAAYQTWDINQAMNVFTGFGRDGFSVYLGPPFWMMHLAQIPFILFMFLSLFMVLMKALQQTTYLPALAGIKTSPVIITSLALFFLSLLLFALAVAVDILVDVNVNVN